MLPDADNDPAFLSQCAVNQTVPLFVPPDLLNPKRPVCLWDLASARMPVPKLAVDKDRYSQLREYKIRISEQGMMPAPSCHVVPTKETD